MPETYPSFALYVVTADGRGRELLARPVGKFGAKRLLKRARRGGRVVEVEEIDPFDGLTPSERHVETACRLWP